MKSRFLAILSAAALALVTSTSHALADDGEKAQSYVQNEHQKLENLLKQPASTSRDEKVTQALNGMVDYEELARRAFGQPCHPSVPGCANHWNELTDEQKGEVKDLLRRLVEKNYRKNLIKTLDYEIAYRGARDLGGGELRIRTEAKSRLRPRDPAVQIDYVVRASGGGYHVVDIVTEGSSLTKNYYDQFHRMLTTPAQGYAHVVKRLNDKLAKHE